MTMSSTPNKLKRTTTPRATHPQRRSRACRRAPGRRTCGSSENKIRDDGDDVSRKLEALKKLIPSEHNGQALKSDQLFKETAEYIMLLRTQVVVLQTLIHIYAPPSSTTSPPDHLNHNHV